LRAQRCDFSAQGGQFGPKRVEVVAANEVKFGGHAIGLGAQRGLRFFARSLGQAHGGGRQLGHFVEEWVLGLHLTHERLQEWRLPF